MPASNRPDFSDFVVHFTKDALPIGAANAAAVPAVGEIAAAGQDAFGRLISILDQKTIRATNMPWTDLPAVCFTECVWGSLLEHARIYSPYGIGFHKSDIYAAKGGPAFYARPGLLGMLKDAPALGVFATPLVPSYGLASARAERWTKGTLDYSHEREWRTPSDLAFELDDVKFLIVDRYEDVAVMPTALKDSIGRGNIYIMANWRSIHTRWPWVQA